MERKPSIWMLAFESCKTVKVGGLGEVPPNLGEALQDLGYDVKVIVPGKIGATKILEGEIYGTRLVLWEASFIKPVHIIVSGELLDDPRVYDASILWDKIRFYTYGVYFYANHMLGKGVYPDIVHGNDWHTIPAMIRLKILYSSKEIHPAFVYQIHLLSRITVREEYLGLYELDPVARLRYYHRGAKEDHLRDIFLESRGLLERFIGLVSDRVLTVSKHYLFDVLGFIGWDLEDKSGAIPNGTKWEYSLVINNVVKQHPRLSSQLTRDLSRDRSLFRSYLELDALGNLPENEPIIPDKGVEEKLREINIYPIGKRGRSYPFRDTGPLAIMSGRLTSQKGWFVLLKAFDEIFYRPSSAKFVLFPLPVGGGWEKLKPLIDAARLYRDSVRIIPGIAKSIYQLAHIAADIMVAPSLYEPFGIMALEAMACGTPIVASKTGGLAETVLDIRKYGVLGTGLHVRPGSPRELADAIVDLLLFMETGYHKPWSSTWNKLVESIRDRALAELLIRNPKAPWRVRESCIRRAREYSWVNAARKATKEYSKALKTVKSYIGKSVNN